MICPICSKTIDDASASCPHCGSELRADEPSATAVRPAEVDTAPEFIFCEGCGARLSAQDRTCPKCGRPAPGILSEESAAADLAAGKTASFPRVTADMLADAIPVPSGPFDEEVFAPHDSADDGQATSVLDGDAIASRVHGDSPRDACPPARRSMPGPKGAPEDGGDPYARRKTGRLVVISACLVLLAGGVWFVSADPLGVMPGFYEAFDRAASDMYPSRQSPEKPAESEPGGTSAEQDEQVNGSPELSDSSLSEAEAFQRLSVIYGQILTFQEDLAPVVDTYNGQYLAKDPMQRKDASASAFALRDRIQKALDEIDALKLIDGTAYAEDVEHMRQLATWMYNRVDVLCRSWDISLGLPEGERPVDHQDEILAPLREVEMINGKAVDVVEYEENVGAWRPVEK